MEAYSGSASRNENENVRRYGLAVLAAIIALLLRRMLTPLLGESYPYHTLWAATVFCAWYYGLGPSILTALAGVVGIWYWFLPPVHSFELQDFGADRALWATQTQTESALNFPIQLLPGNADMLIRCTRRLALISLLALFLATVASAQKIKVIVDQDARGPGTSDQQALLVFLQSEKFDVLGITTVSGDQWVKEETQHTLRMLEIAGRTDVPLIQGAEFPLLNSKEETERWEALYGKLEYKGCWTEHFEATRSTIYDEPYHAPDVVPPMKEGEPHIHAQPGTAAEFIVQMVHKYPGEVVLWAGGPLTNYALALKLDPSVAMLAKEFVMMGGGLYADKGAIDPGAIDARREFNWWFDPEATRIVLRAPWKKVTITPIDISVKTRYTTEMKATITKAHTPVTEYLEKHSLPGYMWDEIAGAALIDPSIITGQKQLYMDIDVDHGASYGKTIFWNSTAQVPPYLRLANVQFDIDAAKFYKIYIDLMTRPPRK